MDIYFILKFDNCFKISLCNLIHFILVFDSKINLDLKYQRVLIILKSKTRSLNVTWRNEPIRSRVLSRVSNALQEVPLKVINRLEFDPINIQTHIVWSFIKTISDD